MSTICKLDPQVRQRRHARANLLRNPPTAPKRGTVANAAYYAVLDFLARARKASWLTGTQKHDIFVHYGRKLAEFVKL